MEQKHRIKTIIQVSISLVLLTFLFRQINPAQLKQVFLVISFLEAITIAALLIPSILVRGFRWRLLFENEFHKISLIESIQLLFVGLSLNLFLPASSGDIIKSYYGYRWSGVKERMLSVSLLDKVIALGSVAVLGIPFGIYRHDTAYLLSALSVLIAVVVLILFGQVVPETKLFLGLLERLNRWTREKINFLSLLRHSQVSLTKLFRAVILSVLGWLITYFQMYCCFRAVNADISISFVLTVAPLLTLARLFPFALNGLGTDEMVLYFIFQAQGLSLEQIITAALLFRIIVIILPGLPGMWILLTKHKLHSVIDLNRMEKCE